MKCLRNRYKYVAVLFTVSFLFLGIIIVVESSIINDIGSAIMPAGICFLLAIVGVVLYIYNFVMSNYYMLSKDGVTEHRYNGTMVNYSYWKDIVRCERTDIKQGRVYCSGIKLVFKDNEYVFSYSRAAIKYISRYCDVGEFMLEEKASQRSRMWIYIIVVVFIIVWCLMFGRGK